MSTIQPIFENVGGEFLTPIEELAMDLTKVKGFVFDWDGVFNTGIKTNDSGSPYAEPDSMGINMLRFSYWLKTGSIPPIFILTGANNQTAIHLARRENMNAVFLNYKNKKQAIETIEKEFDIQRDQLAYIFDDILDLSACILCRTSFCVWRDGSPLFTEHIVSNELADYITGNAGGQNAVREICELVIGLNGNYDKTIEERVAFSDVYQNYLSERNKVELEVNNF